MSGMHDRSNTSSNQYSRLKSFFTKPNGSRTAPVLPLPKSGDIIQLDGFGGSFELTDGQTATLQNLVDISVGGVILFTYPKANTPGCECRTIPIHDSSVTTHRPWLEPGFSLCLEL